MVGGEAKAGWRGRDCRAEDEAVASQRLPHTQPPNQNTLTRSSDLTNFIKSYQQDKYDKLTLPHLPTDQRRQPFLPIFHLLFVSRLQPDQASQLEKGWNEASSSLSSSPAWSSWSIGCPSDACRWQSEYIDVRHRWNPPIAAKVYPKVQCIWDTAGNGFAKRLPLCKPNMTNIAQTLTHMWSFRHF